jgi:hypothetical protein
MIRLFLAAALATLPVLPATAAPGCTIGPLKGMQSKAGATVSMRVARAGKPCGTKLWVQTGIIPYTALRVARDPQHGNLTVSDPTQFSYTPAAGYQGTDQFEILALGNNSSGSPVTGTLTVNVTVGARR